jgi:hypothetical protein
MGQADLQNTADGIVMRIFFFTLIIFAVATVPFAFAKPFLVCDPSPSAVGGNFEILENGEVVHKQANQADGSIRWDLAIIPMGDHNYAIRYEVGGNPSEIVPVQIRGTRCYIKGPDGKGLIIQKARTKCLTP